MNDFLYNNYHLVYRGLIGLSVITGLICYKKFKNSNTQYFIWFLLYILTFELIGSYVQFIESYEFFNDLRAYLRGTLFEKNFWVYNLFWNILSTLFLSFYYTKNIRDKRYVLIVKIITVLFILFTIIYVSLNFEDFFTRTLIAIKLFAAIVIILNIMFYFIEVLNGESILTFYKSFNFYVSAALLIWWLVTTPVVFYQAYYSTSDWNFIFLRWQIFLFANIFMYSTFVFALIYCKPEKQINEF